MPKMDFRGKSVILTGASSGIGRELARRLAERGAWLCLAGRDGDRLETAAAECRAAGGRAAGVQTDVTVPSQCENLVRRAAEEYGRVDVLVANAGLSMWARFEDVTDLSLFERLMAVNYLGAVYCTHFALPHLRRSAGLITAVSSLTGKNGVPTRTGYAASKHAMIGFFDSLRIELAGSGVDVTVICPGFVATEVRERALGPDGRPLGRSPLLESRVMTAAECAALMLRAMERRQRELVMTARGKIGLWMKLAAPGLVDRTARRAIEKGR